MSKQALDLTEGIFLLFVSECCSLGHICAEARAELCVSFMNNEQPWHTPKLCVWFCSSAHYLVHRIIRIVWYSVSSPCSLFWSYSWVNPHLYWHYIRGKRKAGAAPQDPETVAFPRPHPHTTQNYTGTLHLKHAIFYNIIYCFCIVFYSISCDFVVAFLMSVHAELTMTMKAFRF